MLLVFELIFEGDSFIHLLIIFFLSLFTIHVHVMT